MQRAIHLIVLSISCVLLTRAASADVLYDTLSISYPNAAAIVGDEPYLSYDDMEFAFSFTISPSSSQSTQFELTKFGVSMGRAVGGPNAFVEFRISNDVNGEPGQTIDSFRI